MISSFCLQIMTGCITQCLFVDFFFMLWIHFLISSLPHYGLIKIKVVKKTNPFWLSHESIASCFWLVKNKKHKAEKTKATGLIWSLHCGQLGWVCCYFSLTVKLLYHQLWLLNLTLCIFGMTLCHNRNEGCRKCTIHSVGDLDLPIFAVYINWNLIWSISNCNLNI